jgi:hypothetical protein
VAAAERLADGAPEPVDRYLTYIYNKHVQIMLKRGKAADGEESCVPDGFHQPQVAMTGTPALSAGTAPGHLLRRLLAGLWRTPPEAAPGG